jgi:hypothetical protein
MKIKHGEMGMVRGMHGREKKCRRTYLKDLAVDTRIILKWILRKRGESVCVDYINLVQDRGQSGVAVNRVMDPQAP